MRSVSGSSQSGTEFPPVTVHSITNSGYWHDTDSSDVDSKKHARHHHHHHRKTDDESDNLLTVSQLDGVTSPYSSEVNTPSRRSSTSSDVFIPDPVHYYCFTDIDDEVFYGVATRVTSPTLPSIGEEEPSLTQGGDGLFDDRHSKMMSVTPEFVLGIIYARRRKNQDAHKYVEGLPADVMLGIERPVSFWFCLSVCE